MCSEIPKMWSRGRVSLRPVTSSVLCVVAAGLGPGLCVWKLCLSIKAAERRESREACEVHWAASSQAAPFDQRQYGSLYIATRTPKLALSLVKRRTRRLSIFHIGHEN